VTTMGSLTPQFFRDQNPQGFDMSIYLGELAVALLCVNGERPSAAIFPILHHRVCRVVNNRCTGIPIKHVYQFIFIGDKT